MALFCNVGKRIVGSSKYSGGCRGGGESLQGEVNSPQRVTCRICCSADVRSMITGCVHRFGSYNQCEWRFELMNCLHCGVAFVSPSPSPAILQTFYTKDYGSYLPLPDGLRRRFRLKATISFWKYQRSRRLIDHAKRIIADACEMATGRFSPITTGIPLQLETTSRIIDVGFGSGDWLLGMQRLGYENLTGFDFSVNAASHARLNAVGIKTFSGDFMSNKEIGHDYECIRLEHVLEHVRDPVAFLCCCRMRLRRGGTIVLTVPSIESWGMQNAILNSPSLQLPRHLFLHSARSLRMSLEQAGFANIVMRHTPVASQLHPAWNAVRKPLPRIAFEMCARVYAVCCRSHANGDFLMAAALSGM